MIARKPVVRFHDYILATVSNSSYVIKFSEDVHFLVSKDGYAFARDPDSFYKFGYFEPPEEISEEKWESIIKLIKESMEDFLEEKSGIKCYAIPKEKNKEAYEEFLKQI